MSYPSILQEALEVNGVAIANNDATVFFNKQRGAIKNTKYYLTPGQTKQLSKYVGMEVYGRGEQTVFTDHFILAAARDLARSELDRMFSLLGSPVETLYMGVSGFELQHYEANCAAKFYFHGGDAKDPGRLAMQVVQNVVGKLKKNGFRLSALPKARRKRLLKLKTTRLEGWIESYNCGEGLERLFTDREAAFSSRPTRLVYLDSAYDVGLAGVAEDMARSGASEAIVLGFFPNFLIDEAVPENDMYIVEEVLVESAELLLKSVPLISTEIAFALLSFGTFSSLVPIVGVIATLYLTAVGKAGAFVPLSRVLGPIVAHLKGSSTLLDSRSMISFSAAVIAALRDRLTVVTVTWKNGYSNGYGHNKHVWKSLLHQRRYRSYAFDFDIVSEIIFRAGEIYALKLERSSRSAGPIYSRLELDAQFDYVQILDFSRSWDAAHGCFKSKEEWKWVSIERAAFESLYIWASAEPEGTLTHEMVINAAAKMKDGLAINNNEYLPAWKLQSKTVPWLALAVLLEVHRNQGTFAQIMSDEAFIQAWESNLSRWLKSLARGVLFLATGGLVVPVLAVVRWLLESHPEVEIVRYRPQVPLLRYESCPSFSEVVTKLKKKRPSVPGNFGAVIKTPQEKTEVSDCPICDLFQGSIGEQNLVCEGKIDNKVKIAFGETDVTRLKNDLAGAEAMFLASGNKTLAESVERARKSLPITGFSKEIEVEFFLGAAGVGKTFVFYELLALLEANNESVTVTAPFGKLAPEFANFSTLDGVRHIAEFKTQHYLLMVRNRRVLLVDEIGAYDVRLLSFAIYVLNVEKIYIAGDPKQTLLQESEGLNFMAPGSFFPYSDLSRHTLQIQHRSNKFITGWINYTQGYSLVPAKKRLAEEWRPPVFISLAEFNKLEHSAHFPKMVFSHDSAAMFNISDSQKEKVTVRSNQGQTLKVSRKPGQQLSDVQKGVALGLQPSDACLFDVHGMMYVALTRHSFDHTLYIVYEGLDTDPHVHDFKIKARLLNEDIERIKATSWPSVVVSGGTKPKGDDIETGTRVLKFSQTSLVDEQDAPVGFDEEAVEEAYSVMVEEYREVEKERGSGLGPGELSQLELAADLLDVGHYHPCTLQTILAFSKDDEEESRMRISWLAKVAAWEASLSEARRASLMVDGKLLVDVHVLREVFSEIDRHYIFFLQAGHLMADSLTLALLDKGLSIQELLAQDVIVGRLDEMHLSAVLYPNQIPVFREKTVSIQYKKKIVTVSGISYSRIPLEEGWSIPYFRFHEVPGSNVYARQIQSAGLNMRAPSALKRVVPIKFSQTNEIKIRPFSVVLAGSYVSDLNSEPFRVHRYIRCRETRRGMDSHRLWKEVDSTVVNEYHTRQPWMNAHAIAKGPTVKFKKGTFLYVDGLRTQRTANGTARHDKKVSYRSATPGLTLHYGRSAPEELIAAQRMLRKKAKYRWSWEGVQYARKLAHEFFQKNFDKTSPQTDTYMLRAIQHRFRQDAKVRGYDKRALKEISQFRHPFLVTFQNKRQLKPLKNGALKLEKGGQGLSMSSSQMNITHGETMRALNWMFWKRFKGFYDNYDDQQVFRKRLTDAIRAQPMGSMVAVGDAREFDSGQNWFTVALEAENRRLLGMKEHWVRSYYACRGPTKLIAYGKFKGPMSGEKGSGFLDTLLGNGTCAATLADCQISGVGRKVIAKKGDDYLRVQVGMKTLPDVARRIRQFTPVDYSVVLSRRGGEYTGEVVTREGMFKDVVRSARKYYATPSPESAGRGGYSHFVEMQKSVRDAVKDVYENSERKTLAATAQALGTNIATVELHFSALQALGHLSYEQWLALTSKRSVPLFSLPTAKGPSVPL